MNKKSGSMASLFVVVIVAFFLPFYEVSCNGNRIEQATGYELSTSSVKPANVQGEVPDTNTPWLVVVPALAVAGAVLSILAARRPAGARRLDLAAVGAAAAIVLSLVVNFLVIRARIRSGIPDSAGGDPDVRKLAEELTAGIAVNLQVGWFLAAAASLAAGAVGALGLKPAQQPPPAPAATPGAPT
jgi:hypothetical protein